MRNKRCGKDFASTCLEWRTPRSTQEKHLTAQQRQIWIALGIEHQFTLLE